MDSCAHCFCPEQNATSLLNTLLAQRNHASTSAASAHSRLIYLQHAGAMALTRAHGHPTLLRLAPQILDMRARTCKAPRHARARAMSYGRGVVGAKRAYMPSEQITAPIAPKQQTVTLDAHLQQYHMRLQAAPAPWRGHTASRGHVRSLRLARLRHAANVNKSLRAASVGPGLWRRRTVANCTEPHRSAGLATELEEASHRASYNSNFLST